MWCGGDCGPIPQLHAHLCTAGMCQRDQSGQRERAWDIETEGEQVGVMKRRLFSWIEIEIEIHVHVCVCAWGFP